MRAALADPKVLNHVLGASSQVAKDVGGEENWNRLVTKARGAAGETEAISGADSIERIHAHAVTSQKDIMDKILSGGTGGAGTSIRNFFLGNRRLQSGNRLQTLSAAAGQGHESWVAASLLGGKALSSFRRKLSPADQKAFAEFEKKTDIHGEKFRSLREDLKNQTIEGLSAGIGGLEDTAVEAKRAGVEHTLGVGNTKELREKFGKKGETDEAMYSRLAQGMDLSQYTSQTKEQAKTGAAGAPDTQSRLAMIDASAKEFSRREEEQPGSGMAVVADSFESSTKDFSTAVDKFTEAVNGKSAVDQVSSAWDSVTGSVTDNPYNSFYFGK